MRDGAPLTGPLRALLACVLLAASTGAAEPETLRAAARGRFLVGCAVTPAQLDDPALAALVGAQFDALTAENAMKPDAL